MWRGGKARTTQPTHTTLLLLLLCLGSEKQGGQVLQKRRLLLLHGGCKWHGELELVYGDVHPPLAVQESQGVSTGAFAAHWAQGGILLEARVLQELPQCAVTPPIECHVP